MGFFCSWIYINNHSRISDLYYDSKRLISFSMLSTARVVNVLKPTNEYLMNTMTVGDWSHCQTVLKEMVKRVLKPDVYHDGRWLISLYNIYLQELGLLTITNEYLMCTLTVSDWSHSLCSALQELVNNVLKPTNEYMMYPMTVCCDGRRLISLSNIYSSK